MKFLQVTDSVRTVRSTSCATGDVENIMKRNRVYCSPNLTSGEIDFFVETGGIVSLQNRRLKVCRN